jgi:hypothetical protein
VVIARNFGFSVAAVSVALFLSVAGRGSVSAQQQPPPQAPPAAGQPPGGGRGGPPKNLQVLKDVPPDQLQLTMQYIAASLGVQCNFCHVQGQNELDDKETKKTARRMMKMVDQLNSTFFDGKPRISCASCHNGRSKPVRTAPLAINLTPEQAAAAAAGRGRGGPGRGAGPQEPAAPTETVDQVIAKYVQALGGEQALQNAKTRVMTGTQTTRDLTSSNITVQEKATGHYRIDIATQPNPAVRASTGTAAWAVGGGGGRGGGAPDAARDLTGFQMQQALRLADFGLPLHMKERYPTLLVNKSYETINGKSVVVLTGTPYQDVVEQLSFDRESGLLVRRTISTGSGGTGFNIMNLGEQIDYSDYRDVGGVKVAHTVRHATWNQVTTENFADVKINVPVADEVFAKPAPR